MTHPSELLEVFGDRGEHLGTVSARELLGQLGEWLADKSDAVQGKGSAATSVRTLRGYVATLEVHRLHDETPTVPEIAAQGRELLRAERDVERELVAGEELSSPDLDPDSEHH